MYKLNEWNNREVVEVSRLHFQVSLSLPSLLSLLKLPNVEKMVTVLFAIDAPHVYPHYRGIGQVDHIHRPATKRRRHKLAGYQETQRYISLSSPNSDLSQISRCSIKNSLVREVVRIENMITQV